MLGDKIGDVVIASNLLVNLNKPSQIENPSWIKPGKSLWTWRLWGYETQDGFVYELNTESIKRMIDFASKNNIQYVLIDAEWYGSEFSENSDPTLARKEFNIEESMKYASERKCWCVFVFERFRRQKGLD